MLRILHTSDWHLGQNLFHKDRREEHAKFLDWLLVCLVERDIDTLIIAGDIFDSVVPPNYALTLYYQFLRRLADTPCRHTIIVGGNHDSAASLHAPRELLRIFNIHVVGSISKESPDDDIVVLRDNKEAVAGVVCAIPFLRERDIRVSSPGESQQQKREAYCRGVAGYYNLQKTRALAVLDSLGVGAEDVPLIGTGHLFTAGGELSEGVRDISVGNLDGIPASVFPPEFDYLALGHLHKAQVVQGSSRLKYSGAPIPLSFDEVGSAKEVTVVSFQGREKTPIVEVVPVPKFQEIAKIRGDWPEIENFFADLDKSTEIWLEVQLDTDLWGSEAQERVADLAAASAVQVLAVRNYRKLSLRKSDGAEVPVQLAELNPGDVFCKILKEQAPDLKEDDRQELTRAFNEVMQEALTRHEGEQHAD